MAKFNEVLSALQQGKVALLADIPGAEITMKANSIYIDDGSNHLFTDLYLYVGSDGWSIQEIVSTTSLPISTSQLANAWDFYLKDTFGEAATSSLFRNFVQYLGF